MDGSIVLKTFLDLLSVILIGVIPVLTTKLIKFINIKIALAKESSQTENEKRILEAIQKTVETVVNYVSQTFVDTLKNKGEFTPEEQAAALKMALEKTEEMLTEEAKEFIMANYGDITEWLTTIIEATVKTNKMVTASK
jgi:biopolymer transport protein ExbB/TolQ